LTVWKIFNKYSKVWQNSWLIFGLMAIRTKGNRMANYFINVFLDDEKQKEIKEIGLQDNIVEVDGKKTIQVEMTPKEQKKLIKGFPDLEFDSSNACVLPEEAENKLFGIIKDMKTVDVMKFAIMKLYNPLAGKAPRAARFS
jgi:hypothetical protein